MRSIRDLESAFAELAETAPDPDVLSVPAETPRRHSSRRRLLAPAAAAAVVVAVVGGIVVATTGSSGQDGAAGPGNDELHALRAPESDHASPDLTFRFTADAPAGVDTVTSYGIDRGGQVLEYRTPATGRACPQTLDGLDCRRVAKVTLMWANPPHDPDEANFDVDKLTDRDPAKVNGKDAFFSPGPANAYDRSVKLYWEYAPGAWAEAIARTRAAEVALAESVRPAARRIAVPVAPPSAHDGQYVNTLDAEGPNSTGGYDIMAPNFREDGFAVGWDKSGAGSDAFGNDGAGENPQDVTIEGRTWTITGTTQPVARAVVDGVPVSVSVYYKATRERLEKDIAQLRFASDLNDPSTWFDAADLLR